MPDAPALRLGRRALLGGLAASAAAGWFGLDPTGFGSALAASAAPDRYFLFCYFSGGWDLLLSLDPRDPRAFGPDLRKVTRIDTGFELLPANRRELVTTSVPEMVFGPYVGRLAGHADRLALVRGLSMDTLTHEVGRRRYLTGFAPAGLQARGPALATVLASHLGAAEPIPQLSLRVESYNDRYPAYASAIKVSSVQDLVRGLSPSEDALGALPQQRLDELLASVAGGERTRSSGVLQDAHTFRRASDGLVGLGLDRAFDFGANTPEMEAVRSLYGFPADDLDLPGARAAAAVTALTSGISRCASVVVAADLDHHGPEWADGHGPALEAGFDLVASILEDLAARPYRDTGDSWLDHTTVMVFSEFARSALVNASGGRDHHLLNCALLAGAGVRKGVVLGRSSDTGMAPMAVDLESGQPSEQGVVLKPEHLFRALLASVGVEEDTVGYGVEPLRALLA